ncbi:hypothetical protein KZ844_31150, partial [Pseudomonas aeruginosa]|nr:hypothetical protein [Pseudomonas aeruginosa]
RCLVGSEMCIRDRPKAEARPAAAQRQDRDAARKAWQARLNELSGKNRMPRSRRRAQAYL